MCVDFSGRQQAYEGKSWDVWSGRRSGQHVPSAACRSGGVVYDGALCQLGGGLYRAAEHACACGRRGVQLQTIRRQARCRVASVTSRDGYSHSFRCCHSERLFLSSLCSHCRQSLVPKNGFSQITSSDHQVRFACGGGMRGQCWPTCLRPLTSSNGMCRNVCCKFCRGTAPRCSASWRML